MKILIIVSMLLVLYATLAYAGGLSTTFGEVKLEGLEIGQEYSMEKEAQFPLEVENTSDQVLELKIEALLPEESNLKKGFEPIPDIAWIRLEKDKFTLKPGEKAKTDVIISIPDNKEYSGKSYQVYLWSHTVGRGLGVGLRSRLLFTIG